MNRFAVLKTGGVYAICFALQRTVSVLLIPVYIRALPPAEYGEVAWVMSIGAAAVAVLAFGLESAVTRNYFRLAERREEQRAFLSTVGLFLFVAPAALVGSGLLIGWGLGGAPPHAPLGIGLFGAAAQTSATVFPLAVVRAEERPAMYALITLQYSAVMAVLLLVLVVMQGAGASGWLWANTIAWASVLPYGVLVLRRHWTSAVSTQQLRYALIFGLPLIPHALAHWGLSVSDRIVLSARVSDEQIGIYALGYQAGALMGLLTMAMNWALMPRYARLASSDDPAIASLSDTVAAQVIATGVAGLAFALLVPDLLRLLIPAEYEGSSSVVPWVVLGYSFLGLYYIPTNMLTLVIGQTRWIWVGTALAALANVTLNVIFVPRIGIQAAAINTAVGYAVLWAFVTANAARAGVWVPTLGRYLIAVTSITVVMYGLAQLTAPEGTVAGALVRICWIAASIPLLLAVSYFIPSWAAGVTASRR